MAVVASGIALANLTSKGATVDFLRKTPLFESRGELPFGWPLAWYQRMGGNAAEAPRWPVSRFNSPCLIGNVAMWLAMLASAAVVCEWLLRRYPPRFRGRPRVSTVFPLVLVAVPTVLANLSDFEPDPDSMQGEYYGWPLIWYGHIPGYGIFAAVIQAESWEYSAQSLAGDLPAWLLILAVTALSWNWLLSRYRLPLRWNLKTMFVAVGLVAVACAWFTAARDRALKQDAFVELLGGEESFGYSPHFYYFERWGPKWLDLVGADRFRRSIVGADVEAAEPNFEEQFLQLAELPDLRFLDIVSSFSGYANPSFSRASGKALGGMRQLRMLNVECERSYGHFSPADFHECITAVGKLAQLELLGIHMWEENIDDLSCLDKLTKLKRLKLSVISFSDREDARRNRGRMADAKKSKKHHKHGKPRTLACLPPLPGLEFLNLHERELGDKHLDRLAQFPRLKSLDLSATAVSAEGLAKLAPLDSLEELAINEDLATSAGFEALVGLKRLKVVHICPSEIEENMLQHRAEIAGATLDEVPYPAALALDGQSKLVVLPRELDSLQRALAALRKSHPGIVIDGDYEEFEAKNDVEPPWYGKSFDDDREEVERALRAYARQ